MAMTPTSPALDFRIMQAVKSLSQGRRMATGLTLFELAHPMVNGAAEHAGAGFERLQGAGFNTRGPGE